ncbi:hypothetical protein [Actinomadura sp. 9N215]|uniref:hypothetical protein n=1 Tax=Actinomadura sp. 9N215 TaxID=3375150 RepID=UPI0037B86B1A
MGQSTVEALSAIGYERVHVESDWYDGPRGGVADIAGAAHYFRAVHDYGENDEFYVWPASPDALTMEREQWAIFVAWNDRYEARTTSVERHPGQGGIDARYDELEELLAPHRIVPADARRMQAEWRGTDQPQRYHLDGPAYLGRWRPPE